MNSTDKKSLHAFRSMFAALSQSVKRKYEGKGRDNSRSNSNSAPAPGTVFQDKPLSRADTLRVADEYAAQARASR